MVAVGAGPDELARVTDGVTVVEVTNARFELVLERGEVSDLRPRLLQLLLVDGAHPAHRVGGRGRRLPGSHDLLDLREREAEIVELANPPYAVDGGLVVEAIAALGPSVRLEQANLFVVVDGADRLAAHLRDVAH